MDQKLINESLKKLSQGIINLENAQKQLLRIVEGMDKKIVHFQQSITESNENSVSRIEFEQLQQEFESLKIDTGYYEKPEMIEKEEVKNISFSDVAKELDEVCNKLEGMDLRIVAVEKKIDNPSKADKNG